MRKAPNILYFCNKIQQNLCISKFLEERVKNSYDVCSITYDSKSFENLPWEDSCALSIFDMIQPELIFPFFNKIKIFAHKNEGNVWINTSSSEFPIFIVKCKADIEMKAFKYDTVFATNIFHGKTPKGNIIITDSINSKTPNYPEILSKIGDLVSLQWDPPKDTSIEPSMTWKFYGKSVTPLLEFTKTRADFDSRFPYSAESTKKLNDVVQDSNQNKFDYNEYSKFLKTHTMGKDVIHFDTVSSTMEFVDKLGYVDENLYDILKSVVIVAGAQTQGRGRSSNKWISQNGCLMFTNIFKITNILLQSKVTFIQHLLALSFVMGIRSTEGFENLPIGIKWPNDVYYKGETKIGGILVKNVTIGQETVVITGMGVNISNQHPTVCLNEILRREGITLKTFTIEESLAKTLNYLEKFLYKYFNEKDGPMELINLYYKYWLHSDAKVELIDQDNKDEKLRIKGVIVGINDEGYLRVMTEHGRIITAHPDGNSFDMTKNLIIPK